MNCPKCKSSDLRSNEASSPLSCPKCGGLWLESDSLSNLKELEEFESGGHSYPDHDQRTGLCPQGHGILIRAKIWSDPHFYLEKCPKCAGIWFDKGEWQKLSESQLETNLIDLWSRQWQREQRKRLREQEITALHKESLGEEMYNEIVALAEKIRNHSHRYRALELFQEILQQK